MTISFQVYWISADGQSSLDMGEFCSEEEARYMCAQALDDLIAIGSEDDAAALRAGTWRVEVRTGATIGEDAA